MATEHFIIVGGTTGSGRTLVRRLSEHRHAISLLGRHASAEVEEKRPGVHFQPTELSDPNSIRATIEQCIAERGKPTHIVFFQRYRGKSDAWEGEIEISLGATKSIIELCSDRFDGNIANSIVILTSAASRHICEEQPVSYHVAKSALTQMMRYYAVTLGPKGIRVNAVSPDTVIKDEMQTFYEEHEELRELYNSVTPLRRMGTADDVADVVEFLCSSKAGFITGQEIIVDGGISLSGHGALARRVADLDRLKITR